MCSKITRDILFFLIMHTAHVFVLNILRPTVPCCSISEDQNRWKIKLKAGNDELYVLFTSWSGLYSDMRSHLQAGVQCNYMKYNDTKFITHKNFQFIWFSEICKILYTRKSLRIRLLMCNDYKCITWSFFVQAWI